ncbi:MAG: branched chain amino acid aminotransferase, partial [Acholeplasmataceae bacterium]|nr:branched chain amino acid aminotransferase [Acholeplasmataceae bacterium]
MNIRPKGFTYIKADFSYVSIYKDGKWDEGKLQKEDTIEISMMSTALHYGQQCFEGLKAYRRRDGKVQLFRVLDNAKRFQTSCERMEMPKVPVEKFVDAVKEIVRANEKFVPPYGNKETLYIRPFMIGIGSNLGLRPAPEYLFGIIV